MEDKSQILFLIDSNGAYMGYLFLGIIIGLFVEKYIFSLLDLANEYISIRVSEKASRYQGKIQLLQYRLEEKCSPKQPAIGFSMGELEEMGELEDDDDEEVEDKSKGKIGFRL
jgi:hypothetical protein